jgi:hypothetical protein
LKIFHRRSFLLFLRVQKALFKEKGDEIRFVENNTSFAENSASATKTVIQKNNKTISIVSMI